MRIYDEEIERKRVRKRLRHAIGSPFVRESRFPCDVRNLVVRRPCPRCGGSLSRQESDLSCMNCGAQACSDCGHEMVAGLCLACNSTLRLLSWHGRGR